MPWSPREYRALIDAFRQRGYAFRGFADADPVARDLIVRHDIDFSLTAAEAMAALEHELGVASTYFVLLRTEFYNLLSGEGLVALKRIAGGGHTIGLHFDAALYDAQGDALDAGCAHECELLELALGQPVTVMSYHRPAKDSIGKADWVGGRLNAYGRRFIEQMGYCSDSRGGWYHGEPLAHPAVDEGRALQLLVHPFWWQAPPMTANERLDEFLRQRSTYLDREMARHCTIHVART